MGRKKHPVKDIRKVKSLRAKIADWKAIKADHVSKGLTLTAENDQKLIDAYTEHLHKEIGG